MRQVRQVVRRPERPLLRLPRQAGETPRQIEADIRQAIKEWQRRER